MQRKCDRDLTVSRIVGANATNAENAYLESWARNVGKSTAECGPGRCRRCCWSSISSRCPGRPRTTTTGCRNLRHRCCKTTYWDRWARPAVTPETASCGLGYYCCYRYRSYGYWCGCCCYCCCYGFCYYGYCCCCCYCYYCCCCYCCLTPVNDKIKRSRILCVTNEIRFLQIRIENVSRSNTVRVDRRHQLNRLPLLFLYETRR